MLQPSAEATLVRLEHNREGAALASHDGVLPKLSDTVTTYAHRKRSHACNSCRVQPFASHELGHYCDGDDADPQRRNAEQGGDHSRMRPRNQNREGPYTEAEHVR